MKKAIIYMGATVATLMVLGNVNLVQGSQYGYGAPPGQYGSPGQSGYPHGYGHPPGQYGSPGQSGYPHGQGMSKKQRFMANHPGATRQDWRAHKRQKKAMRQQRRAMRQQQRMGGGY